MLANLQTYFFNKCSLPTFYKVPLYRDHKNFPIPTILPSELHFHSSSTLLAVSLICNLYRFSAQQQQEENVQMKKM